MSIGGHEKPNKGATDVWLTPIEIVSSLGEFDLDPCGESDHRTAKSIYTEKGLDLDWHGRVWLNPPYSEVGLWLKKLSAHGHGIALVFARLETKWAQEMVPLANSVFFPKGRISFLTKEKKKLGNSGAPSMFLAFGEVPDWYKVSDGIVCNVNKRKGE